MSRATGSTGGSRRDPRVYMLQGLGIGALLYMALWALRVPKALLEFDYPWGILVMAGIGAVVYATRARWLLWVAAGLTAGLFVVVVATPVVQRSARSLVRRDTLRKADAVIVLGSATTRERRLDEAAFIRMVDGLRLVHDGWADTLVRTRVGGRFPDASADVAQLAALCGDPRIEVVGPVYSTRDEALQFADLAHSRGWKSVIVVTSPYHSARAAAVFRKTGLNVISQPSTEREFAPTSPRGSRERLAVFRWWLYEELRWMLYRVRGWI